MEPAPVVRRPGPAPLNSCRVLGFEAQAYPAILLGHRLPSKPEVVGSGMGVPVEPLHGAGVEEGVAAAGFEQPVHGADGQLGHVGLVTAVAGPVVQWGGISLRLARAKTSWQSCHIISLAACTSASASDSRMCTGALSPIFSPVV